MRRKATKIASIFGQIEGVVIAAMAAEGKVTLIPFERIPADVQYNEKGTKAICAAIFTPQSDKEFDQRVRELQA